MKIFTRISYRGTDHRSSECFGRLCVFTTGTSLHYFCFAFDGQVIYATGCICLLNKDIKRSLYRE